jgi:hypothetical protein
MDLFVNTLDSTSVYRGMAGTILRDASFSVFTFGPKTTDWKSFRTSEEFAFRKANEKETKTYMLRNGLSIPVVGKSPRKSDRSWRMENRTEEEQVALIAHAPDAWTVFLASFNYMKLSCQADKCQYEAEKLAQEGVLSDALKYLKPGFIGKSQRGIRCDTFFNASAQLESAAEELDIEFYKTAPNGLRKVNKTALAKFILKTTELRPEAI